MGAALDCIHAGGTQAANVKTRKARLDRRIGRIARTSRHLRPLSRRFDRAVGFVSGVFLFPPLPDLDGSSRAICRPYLRLVNHPFPFFSLSLFNLLRRVAVLFARVIISRVRNDCIYTRRVFGNTR